MLDAGLLGGVKTLWQEDLLLDYTVKVEAREFHVHKVVLASVSDYFRAMLTGTTVESRCNKVRLADKSAQRMSDLIDFIYTGDETIIEKNPKEMLEDAVYFQMPKVIKHCTSKLRDMLCVENCLDLLTTFRNLALDEAENVKDFIGYNLKEVMAHYEIDKMTPGGIQIILKNWGKSDWEIFQYLKSWFSADFENRGKCLNQFMSQVRFSFLTPQEIEAVKDMEVYKNGEGAWKELVDKAFAYHQLPVHLKVLDDSRQSKVRGAKSLIVMNTAHNSDGPSSFSLVKGKWKPCESLKPPPVPGPMLAAIEVNNFLITCSKFSEDQTWQVFDPRTLTWSNIASMPKPRDQFALVHYNKTLYVLGGCEASVANQKSPTDKITEYSFETNSWSSKEKLPVAVKNHAACVIDNSIYICGGEIDSADGSCVSTKMDCLDPSSQTWESKAPMLNIMTCPKMFVMPFKNEKVILVVNDDLQVEYYNPVTDQWSTCAFSVRQYDMEYDDDFRDIRDIQGVPGASLMMLVNGGSLLLFNISGKEWLEIEDDEEYDPWYIEREPTYEYVRGDGFCFQWKISLEKHDIKQQFLNDFPVRGQPGAPSKDCIAFVLTVPQSS